MAMKSPRPVNFSAPVPPIPCVASRTPCSRRGSKTASASSPRSGSWSSAGSLYTNRTGLFDVMATMEAADSESIAATAGLQDWAAGLLVMAYGTP